MSGLHVEVSGHGPDIILLHGWGMHGAIWGHTVDCLAASHRVHVVDLPGMGHSAPITPYTLDALADTLVAMLPGPATVLGWSLGGLLAMQMAARQPDQVQRLILVGTTPKFVQDTGWACGMPGDVFIGFAEQVTADYLSTMQRFLALQAFGNATSRDLLRELRARFHAGPLPDQQALQQALAILLGSDLRRLATQLQQPALVLHGDRDTLAPVAAASWMQAQLPQAELAVIAGASHAPFLSHPRQFMQAVNRFLES